MSPKHLSCQSISSTAQLASSTHPPQQQQQCQHQHPHSSSSHSSIRSRRGLVVAAAAGKGFGNPAKTASKGSSKGKRKCPCGSGLAYEACCSRYHSGAASAPTPEALLRSRFSAYALQEVDYLVRSTHKQNPEYTGSAKSYAKALRGTAAAVEYLQLTFGGPVEIEELPQAYRSTLTTPTSTSSSSIDQPPAAAAAADGEDAFLKFSVKFRPREGGGEQVVNEISHFRKVDGQWLYFNEVDV